MMLQCFSVYDAAVQAFLPPFFTRSKGEALRSFSEACNGKDHQFNKHASDYSLFYVGEFDDANGGIQPSVPTRILSALECIVTDEALDREIERAQANGRGRVAL